MFAYAPKVLYDYFAVGDLEANPPRLPLTDPGDPEADPPRPPGPLAGVHVATQGLPSAAHPKAVRLSTAPAGATDNQADALSWRRLIIQCWAPTELAAGDLAETVREHVVASKYARIGVRRVRIVGEPALFPDPATDSPRVQLTADVMLRDH
jgi:hypothetical protein